MTTVSAAPRMFVAGFCPRDGVAYITVSHPNQPVLGGHCGKTCAKRENERRQRRRCPSPGCEQVRRDESIVCPVCYGLLASMCRGKRRLTQLEALRCARSTERVEYECQVCRWWHNGNQIPEQVRQRNLAGVRAAVQGVLAARGRTGLDALAAGWDPRYRSREQWAGWAAGKPRTDR